MKAFRHLGLSVMAVWLAGCNGPAPPAGSEPSEAVRDSWPQVSLRTPFGFQKFYYQVRGDLAFAEGDILLGPAEVIEALAEGRTGSGAPAFAIANTSPDVLWPEGRVPFEFAPDAPHQADISAMMSEYQMRTPIQFVARNDEYHHVVFTSSPINNHGQIGRQWWGGTQVGISPNLTAGPAAQTVIVHEIGHALGMYHEHTRNWTRRAWSRTNRATATALVCMPATSIAMAIWI